MRMPSGIITRMMPEMEPKQWCGSSRQPAYDDEVIYIYHNRFELHFKNTWLRQSPDIGHQRIATWKHATAILQAAMGERLTKLVFAQTQLDKLKKRNRPLIVGKYENIKHTAIEMGRRDPSVYKVWLVIHFYREFFKANQKGPISNSNIVVTKPSKLNCVFLMEGRILERGKEETCPKFIKCRECEFLKNRKIKIFETERDLCDFLCDENGLSKFIWILFANNPQNKCKAKRISRLLFADFAKERITFIRLNHLLRRIAKVAVKERVSIEKPKVWDELKPLAEKPFSQLTIEQWNQLNRSVKESFGTEKEMTKAKTPRLTRKEPIASSIAHSPNSSDSEDSD